MEESSPAAIYDMYPIEGSMILPEAQNAPGYQAGNPETFIPFLQSKADTFCWQNFIAVNWMSLENGRADSNQCFGADGNTVLESWMPTYNIYKDTMKPWNYGFDEKGEPENSSDPMKRDILGKDSDLDIYNAEQHPVIDQNGNFTLFEIFYNKPLYDYVAAAKINTQKGQDDYVKNLYELYQRDDHCSGCNWRYLKY